MKNLIYYITERLKISKDDKVKDIQLRDLSKVDIRNIFSECFWDYPNRDRIRDNHQMEEYYNKGSKPKVLVNSIKRKDKLVRRCKLAIIMNWEDYYDTARQAIIDRGYYSADELDGWVYNLFKASKDECYIRYLEKYHIKFDR